MATGKTEQMTFHFRRAIENGVTQEELLELITHLAFYAGRPNAISAATRAKELFAKNDSTEERVPEPGFLLLGSPGRSFTVTCAGSSRSLPRTFEGLRHSIGKGAWRSAGGRLRGN